MRKFAPAEIDELLAAPAMEHVAPWLKRQLRDQLAHGARLDAFSARLVERARTELRGRRSTPIA